ncbi:uncharacterized protein LOC126840628 [Adelges cooleyi]|uniref:uncharacterized protein LOC126840628 n=1 Tax=Adelges cooleyi TaxID=133065 RepID=UPI0021801B16|nr:uncharacterized protein LOC126840628 [Adelges cooleyi]
MLSLGRLPRYPPTTNAPVYNIIFAMADHYYNISSYYLRAFLAIAPLLLLLLPLQVTANNLEDALVEANSKGFPADLLYNVAKLHGRSHNDKVHLAAALESPDVQEAARKAAIEYAVKDISTSREGTEQYCQYSWLRYLPFMNCDQPAAPESRNTLQVLNIKRSCYKKK